MFQKIMKALGYVRASEVKLVKKKLDTEKVNYNYKPIKYDTRSNPWHTSQPSTAKTVGINPSRIYIGTTRLQHDLLAKYASEHDITKSQCVRQILRGSIPPLKKNPHDRGDKIKTINVASCEPHIIEIVKMFDTTNTSLLAKRIRAKLFV